MTTQTPKEKALEALNKLYGRCIKTAHSPGGEEFIKEWKETIRAALEAAQNDMHIHFGGCDDFTQEDIQALYDCGYGKLTKNAENVNFSEQVNAGVNPAEIPGLDEALKKFEHPSHRVHLLMHPDDKPFFSKITRAARLYAQGATQTQRKNSVDVGALHDEAFNAVASQETKYTPVVSTLAKAHVMATINYLAARYDFFEKEGA